MLCILTKKKRIFDEKETQLWDNLDDLLHSTTTHKPTKKN